MGMEYEGQDGAPTPATLEIRTFGAPEILLDGTPLTELRSAKAQALLFYLAVTRRRHTRPALAGLLWGDLPEAAARANLRKVIYELRQMVASYLWLERDLVGLAEDAGYWVDAVQFDALLRPDLATRSDEHLQRAVDLYRGDFLDGFYVQQAPDFERWWLGEQGRLRDMLFAALTTLADRYAEQGDLDRAITFARRLLDLEPWRESAHRRLMEWLALTGQRGAALAAYKACRRAVAEELGVEPAEATVALYEQIRRGDLKPPPPTTPALPPLVAEPGPPAFVDPTIEVVERRVEPFVGRGREIARLDGFLRKAIEGRGRAVLVSGEAGWGKTRLVAEFARRAETEHPELIVASGACTAFTETGDPYLPFREILRTLAADVEPEWAAGRLPRQRALRLWSLLPRVVEALVTKGRHLLDTFIPGEALVARATAHESVPPHLLARLQEAVARRQAQPRDAAMDQERIFEQVADVLQALSSRQPLLLILDDLHWADISSLSLLFHLGRRLDGGCTLMLSTYRSEDVSLGGDGQEDPLASMLAEFKRLFGDSWVHLGGNVEEGREFVDALLDSEPNRLGRDFRAGLARNTKGHPLFTVEMLRDMQDRGYIYREEDGRWVASPGITWDTLPKRVEGLIERRINRLPTPLRETLAVASVEGEEFTAEVVAQVRRVSEADMVDLLSNDLSRKHQLVQASGVRRLGTRSVSRYRFSHNLFQRYLYSHLDPAQRVYRHEAVGRALESVYEGHAEEMAVHLASHFQEAGNTAKAVKYLRQAGDTAARVYANSEAIAHYSQAVAMVREIGIDSAAMVDLYRHLGRVLELDSQFDRVLETYEAMEQIALQRGDRHMELASLTARATIQAVPTAVHDAERAASLGQRALILARELGDRAAEARILWVLSLANYFMNRLPEAIDCGERSLALARELGLREQTAQTLNDLGGFIYLYSGHIAQAKEALMEASDLWRELGNTPMLVDSLGGSCIAQVYAGEYDQAIALSQIAYQTSEEIDNLWSQSYSLWTIGDAFRARGEYSQAIEASQECIRLAEAAGFLAAQTYTRLKLAMVYADLGAVEQGLELTRTALDVAEAHSFSVHSTLALGVQARLQILQGDLAGAAECIGHARKHPSRETWGVLYLAVRSAEVELALSRQDYPRAAQAARDLITILRQYGMRSGLSEALYLQGKALLGLGDREAARASLADAGSEAESTGARRMLWRILSSLSQLEDDPAEVRALRERAHQILAYIADHIDPPALRASFLHLADVRAVLEAKSI